MVLMGVVVLPLCIIAIVPKDGMSKVEEDNSILDWFMGFYDALTGMISSHVPVHRASGYAGGGTVACGSHPAVFLPSPSTDSRSAVIRTALEYFRI